MAEPAAEALPTAEEWLDAFCARLGVEPPTAGERTALLALAGVAAHSSERRAAPIACWIAGRHGVALDEAMRMARAGAPADAGTPPERR